MNLGVHMAVERSDPASTETCPEFVESCPPGEAQYEIKVAQALWSDVSDLFALAELCEGHRRVEIIKDRNARPDIIDHLACRNCIGAIGGDDGNIGVCQLSPGALVDVLPILIEHQRAPWQIPKIAVGCVVRYVALEKDNAAA